MSEDNSKSDEPTDQTRDEIADRQDEAREKIRQAVDAQQEALAAQQRAVSTTSDAFLAEQEAARVAKKGRQDSRGGMKDGAKVNESRRNFLKISAGAVAGAAIASVIQIPLYDSAVVSRNKEIHLMQAQLVQSNQQVSQLQSQVASLQLTVSTTTGFMTLSTAEQAAVEAIVETIIPSDSNGPGAKEAGAIYFIDRQLAGDYGHGSNMFTEGPFVQPGQTSPVTVEGLVYSGGVPAVRVGAGTRYQYAISMREYWRTGLAALEAYSNTAYGGNFEGLNATQQMQVLQDLWNDIPTSFGLVPQDFAYELTFMTWCGFLMDPLYGGNQNMVGWTYTGYNGVNFGNAYGEGKTQSELMVAGVYTRLQPFSLAQFQNPQSSSGSSSSSSGQQTSSSSSASSQSSGSSTASGQSSTTGASSGQSSSSAGGQ